MALTLGDNFSYQGAKPLDARLKYDTLAAMKAVADATMYDGCMAYCTATDKTYQWKSTNTVDEDTGKWREFSSGEGGSLPSGGTTGQILAKHSNTDGDAEWVDAPSSIPNGGTTGQALVKNSNTDKDVKWETVGGLGYEEKILGAQNFTYNDATLVANGETKIFYSKWDGGSTAGNNAGIPSSPGTVDRYYYIEMTKNTAGTVFVQRCRKFYTQNSTNYVKTYERRCTSSGGTWTYADWIETTGDDSKLYSTDDPAFTDIADADYIPIYDTSASTKKKSLWSNIKSILKTYFDTLYQGVLTAGTNIGISGNVISATNTISLNFSTTEQTVGKWIDGKPLYQKTINFGSLPNNATKSVAHSIANLKNFTKIECVAYGGTGSSRYWWNAPYAAVSVITDQVMIYLDPTNIYIITKKDMTSSSAYITVQYTKTTD